MSWSFALINNKLAEIYFEKRKKIKFLGHAFVKKSEFKTKRELNQIEKDTEKIQLSYKNGRYLLPEEDKIDKKQGNYR